MENNNNINELEQMREQMQMLRNKLDKQEIINDKMLRHTVESRISWIKKFVYFEFLLLPIIALVWFCIKELFGLSWFNFIFMMIMCIIDAVWDYRANVVSLKLNKVEEHTLTDTLKKFTEMKRMRTRSFSIMMPLCAIWLVWVAIEAWQNVGSFGEPGSLMESATYGGFAGLLIGIPLGLYAAISIYRKLQHTDEELIAQINEFTRNE